MKRLVPVSAHNRQPCSGDLDAAISVEIIGMELDLNSLLDSSCVLVFFSLYALHVSPTGVVSGLEGVFSYCRLGVALPNVSLMFCFFSLASSGLPVSPM